MSPPHHVIRWPAEARWVSSSEGWGEGKGWELRGGWASRLPTPVFIGSEGPSILTGRDHGPCLYTMYVPRQLPRAGVFERGLTGMGEWVGEGGDRGLGTDWAVGLRETAGGGRPDEAAAAACVE